MGFVLIGMSLVHTVFWPWYFVFLIWLNRILHRAHFFYLCDPYRSFGITPGAVNTKYQYLWYFIWFVVEIALVITTIYIPLKQENNIFGESTRLFGERGEDLNLFYNFAIYLQ